MRDKIRFTSIGLALVVLLALSQASQAVVINGQWFNTSFVSFAPAIFDIQITPPIYSISLDLEAGPNGAVFGGLNPPPIVFAGNFEGDGSVIINIPGHPLLGDVTGTISPAGAIDIMASDIPHPFAPGNTFGDATLQGTFDGTTIDLHYEIIFEGGQSQAQGGIERQDFALGTITGAIPEPATMSMLAIGGLALIKRQRAIGFDRG